MALIRMFAPDGIGSVYTSKNHEVIDGIVLVDSAWAMSLLSAGFSFVTTEQQANNMAKYLVQNSGVLTEQATTTVSSGAASTGLVPNLDAGGKLDASMFPSTFGRQSIVLVAGEALAAGAFVYIKADGKVYNAIATVITNEAIGFVTAAVALSGSATVFLDETNTALSGLTPGSLYFLSAAAAGAATLTAPSTATQIVQVLGRAVSATEIRFSPAPSIVLT